MRNHRVSTFWASRYGNTRSASTSQENTTGSFWVSKPSSNPVKRPSNAIGKHYGWWSMPGRDFHKKHSLGNSTQRYADGHDTTEVSWQRKSSTTVTTISIPFSFDGPNADIRESQQAGYGCGTGAPLGKIAGALPHRRATLSLTMRQSRSNATSR